MNIQHINVKIFIDDPETIQLADFGVVFNSWIQRRALDELLIDVADYLHVHHGPGIMLIGHEADYSLDQRTGRLGLLYNRKAQIEGTTQEKLTQALQSVLTAARILEKENGLKFNTQELQVIVNDRLLVPNTLETFEALEADLRTFFGGLYNGAEYTLTHHTDPRERFTVNLITESRFVLESLIKNLSVAVAHV